MKQKKGLICDTLCDPPTLNNLPKEKRKKDIRKGCHKWGVCHSFQIPNQQKQWNFATPSTLSTLQKNTKRKQGKRKTNMCNWCLKCVLCHSFQSPKQHMQCLHSTPSHRLFKTKKCVRSAVLICNALCSFAMWSSCSLRDSKKVKRCDVQNGLVLITHSVYCTYEWVMAHMNGSCHIWRSHGTYEWVIDNATQLSLITLLHTSRVIVTQLSCHNHHPTHVSQYN